MTWAISLDLCRPGRVPEPVKLERRSERVYRVVWSLSDTSGGWLRRS